MKAMVKVFTRNTQTYIFSHVEKHKHLFSHQYSNTTSCTAAQSLIVDFKAHFGINYCENMK